MSGPKESVDAQLQELFERTLDGHLVVHRDFVEEFFADVARRVRAAMPGDELVVTDSMRRQWSITVPSTVIGDDVDALKRPPTGSA